MNLDETREHVIRLQDCEFYVLMWVRKGISHRFFGRFQIKNAPTSFIEKRTFKIRKLWVLFQNIYGLKDEVFVLQNNPFNKVKENYAYLIRGNKEVASRKQLSIRLLRHSIAWQQGDPNYSRSWVVDFEFNLLFFLYKAQQI